MPDVARIFALTLEQAKNDLIGKKELPLAHIYAFKPDGSMSIFALDPAIFNPDGTKQLYARMLRQRLIDEGYEAYGFCSEAWVSSNREEYELPEQDPERREVLMIIVGTKERGFQRNYEMNRRPNGTVRRLSEQPYSPDMQGGRFGHLLTPQPWDFRPDKPAEHVLRH